MIKFFRRIRQQLLSDLLAGKTGRFSKYLLYAVGEIFLVVIGILIALAVNNWNQQQNNRRLGEDYLTRIHRDLVQDTTHFRTVIIRNNKLREEIKELLVTLYEGVENMDEVQQMSATYDKALDQVFAPNDNTYKGMVSSGNLGLIENRELKEKIIDIYSEYDQIKALLSAIGQWMITMATTETIGTDFIKFNRQVSDIFTTPEMLNESDYAFLNNKQSPKFKLIVRTISATAFTQQVNNAYYSDLIGKCHAVLGEIDKELSR